MNPKTKKKLLGHLQYCWWMYIGIALAAVFLWTSVFLNLAKPASNERIGLFLCTNAVDTTGLEKDISDILEGLTEQEIKQFRVNQMLLSEADVGSVLTARSFDCDLIFIQQSFLREGMAVYHFAPLPMEQIGELLPNHQFYSDKLENVQNTYGILIGGKGVHNRFTQYYTGEEAVYVFLSRESVNLGGLNEKGYPEDDAALRLLLYLLEETNG